jgi:phosphoglycerol transferase MdoB-like AlkP superfamily enzyme
MVGAGRYLWNTEPTLLDFVFTAGILSALGAMIILVGRRVLVATILVAGLLALMVALCTVTSQETNILLHAYNLVLYAGSWVKLWGLWQDYHWTVLAFLCALAATLASAWIAYQIDRTRVRRTHAALLFLTLAALTGAALATKSERKHHLYYFWNIHVGAFLLSFGETFEALWRGQLIEAADRAPGPLLTIPRDCRPDSRPPHILLIHQESVVPPTHFPSLVYDRSLDPFFHSFDGKLHTLRVETYGGSSWLTEFSILVGLSAQSFGGMRQLVQPVLAGKVRDTLPAALARCGYRRVVFYPALRSFAAVSKFFKAVGIGEIFDAKDQNAEGGTERDRFYYANALDEMGRHLNASRQPLFLYIQTAATHAPYEETYWPEVQVPGGGPGTHPQMHEYLRRLSMARIDYDFLRAELSRRFPDEQFLIVHYGDHQPTATLTLLGYSEETYLEEVIAKPNPRAFLTYFAVDALNYRPPALPDLKVIDVPYLGTILLEAAGLPLSDSYHARKRLMAICRGRYFGCSQRHEILGFHRRLIDSGLLDGL